MKTPLHVALTVRLVKDEKCFGPGIEKLLTRIAEMGSLRAAAADMGMAYSKAWRILRTAEAELGFKLIDSTTGGRTGGGARLTDEGERLLREYREFERECRESADALFKKHFKYISDSSL